MKTDFTIDIYPFFDVVYILVPYFSNAFNFSTKCPSSEYV